MKCYLLKIITILTISSAIEATKEICPCVPLNTCPDTQQFKQDDAKYFATILKCNDDGFVRCCKDNELQVTALRRMDEDESLVMTDEAETEDYLTSTTTEVNEEPETTENLILEPEDDETTSEMPITTTTTENIYSKDLNLPDNDRKSKFIDEHVEVVYPNLNVDTSIDANKKPIESLFIIFPNNDVETVLEEEKVTEPVTTTTTTKKPYKRVIIRKRLRKKERTIENLEGAESQVSKTVVEPQPIDVEKVKKRLVQMLNSRFETTTPTSLSTTENTDSIEDVETTTKKKRKKLKKYRKSTTSATTKSSLRGITSSIVTLSTEPSVIKKLQKNKTVEITEAAITTRRLSIVTTMKPKRKLLYDTSSRTNFLKKPHIQPAHSHDDYEEEHEEIHDHEIPIFEPTSTQSTTTEEPTTTTHVPVVLKLSALIDGEHKSMIETVRKTLKAIHTGVDMKIIRTMIDEHQERVNELRKNPPKMTVPTSRFTTATEPHHSRHHPTRPFRGSVRFNRPSTTVNSKSSNSYPSQPRTRNLSRTRSTTLTPNKSVRKTHQRQTIVPHAGNNNVNEELNMPPKQKPSNEFHASPLYGITVDKENNFDIQKIEQMYETFTPSKDIQNGFFPVISNGTPSTVI